MNVCRHIACVIAVVLLIGCSRESSPLQKVLTKGKIDTIEISPGKFINIKRLDFSVDQREPGLRGFAKSFKQAVIEEGENFTSLAIPWKNTNVYWGAVDIPISLREYNGNLYVIGFDRETNRKEWCFHFYCLTNGQFTEVKAQQYPRSIVVQNMWFKNQIQSYLEATLELNPDRKGFNQTLTATLWYLLETGKEYHQLQGGCVGSSERPVLKQYVEKYHPQKLTRIVQQIGDQHRAKEDVSNRVENIGN